MISRDNVISASDVIVLHGECLKRHGGLPGLRDAHCPDRSVGAAQSYCDYPDLSDGGQVEDGLLFSACLCFYLCENHCFNDGNKRVAWAVAMKVLEQLLDMTIAATDDETTAFVLAIASRREDHSITIKDGVEVVIKNTVTISGVEVRVQSVEDVVRWMSERLVPCPHISRPH